MATKHTALITVLALILLACAPALTQEEERRLFVPLDAQPAPLNECAGTMQHYRFRSTGYHPQEKTKSSERGRALYERHNCKQCHSIRGIGGELGPPLDGVGGHRGRQWLTARLLDPEKQMRDFPDVFGGRPNIMPHPGINRKEAEHISDYLLTLAEPKAGFSVAHHPVVPNGKEEEAENWKPQPEDVASRAGKQLFIDLHCGACHSLDGGRDRFGPDLAGVGARISPKRLEKILEGSVRSSLMKEQTKRLGEERVYDLKAFLLTIPARQTNNKR